MSGEHRNEWSETTDFFRGLLWACAFTVAMVAIGFLLYIVVGG